MHSHFRSTRPTQNADLQLLCTLAQAYGVQGDYARCINQCNQLLFIDATLVAALMMRGLSRFMLGEFDAAIADYNAVIIEEPDFAAAYGARAVAHIQQTEFKRAFEDLARAIDLDDREPQFYLNRANLCMRLGDYDQAIDDLLQCLHLKVECEYLLALAHAYYQGRYYAEAADAYSKALHFYPDDLETLYFARGCSYQAMFDLERAAADYTRVIECNPKSAEAHFSRGFVHLLSMQDDKALIDLLKAAELAPILVQMYEPIYSALDIDCTVNATPKAQSAPAEPTVVPFSDRWGVLNSA